MQKTICLLPGDGIGPEIVAEAVKVLRAVEKKFGHSFTMTEALLGGAAIDAVGVPLPDATVEACKAADAVFLGAVGGPKWDGVPGDKRPEKGLSGQCLHARALRFLHPRTGELVTFTCPLPDYFQDVLARLGPPVG